LQLVNADRKVLLFHVDEDASADPIKSLLINLIYSKSMLSSPSHRITANPANVSEEALFDRRWIIAAVYSLLVIVALYPVFAVDIPPLVDYPNHLARIFLLANLEQSLTLQQNYVSNWDIRPNMAMDLILPPMAKIVPIYDLGRAFVALTLLLNVSAVVVLRRVAVGHVGYWPVLAMLVLYNHALFWGFLSYLFTTGLALIAFAGWLALQQRSIAFRLVFFAGTAVALFVSHIFGLLIYGLLVVGHEIWRTHRSNWSLSWIIREWPVSGAQFILPAALFLRWAMLDDAVGDAVNKYGTWRDKLNALFSPVNIGLPLIDTLTAVFLVCVLVWCLRSKHIGIAPALKIPVILLTAVTVMMPNYLSGVWGTDFRLPAILVCVLLASVAPSPGAAKQVQVIVVLGAALLIGRSYFIADHWKALDDQFAEFRIASAAITSGAAILEVQDPRDKPDTPGRIVLPAYWHLGALAVIDRAVFFPTLFTGHTSINASPDREAINTPVGTPVTRDVFLNAVNDDNSPYPLGHRLSRYFRLYFIGWQKTYDYVLSVRFDNASPLPSDALERVHAGSYFDIYRVKRPRP